MAPHGRLCTVQVRAVKAGSSPTLVTFPSTNDDTRPGGCGSTITGYDVAVDDDSVDAGGRIAWLLPCRSGSNGGRVENDEVGCEAFGDAPAVRDPEALGRQTAHQVDRPLKGHETALADERPEHLGIAAVAARMG